MQRNSSRNRRQQRRKRPQSSRNAACSQEQRIEQTCEGVLELHAKGYGFLRRIDQNFARHEDDPFVSESLINRYSIRSGQVVAGTTSTDKSRSTGPRLTSIARVGDGALDACSRLFPFDEQTAVNPNEWLRLEHRSQPVSMRVLDLFCPLGRGQRALIASPPKAGKTTLLKEIGRSVSLNHPDVELAALLIDERPEEVTDFRSDINGRVFASHLDEVPESHARLSRLVIDYCQRRVESGKHVFLLVDSLTRMSRAFNKLHHLSGPIGAGGLNIRALDVPKQLFASARNLRGGGSLTIVASVLVETDNRMDEVIFREFKGTGNLDIVLSQQLADRRIWPAIDILQSSTRRVELLHDELTLQATATLRNTLLRMQPAEATKELTEKLSRFATNDAFVQIISDSLN